MFLFLLSAFLFYVRAFEDDYDNEDYGPKLPLFTPFDLNKTDDNGGYIIHGVLNTTIHLFGMVIPNGRPCKMVIDPQNNRMLYDIGTAGVQVITNDGSYIYGNALQNGGGCMRVNGWTYAKQVEGYGTATSLLGSTVNKATYTGRIHDVATCNHGLAVVFQVKQGIMRTYRFDQYYSGPLLPDNGLVCALVQGVIQFDIKTLDRNVTRINEAFATVLPADCTTSSPDYCNIAYPVGNPCIISQ